MLLGFQKQFVNKILSGEKRQTIRTKRKYPIKVNDKLHLYYGLRTKQCKKLLETVCGDVLDIELRSNRVMLINDYLCSPEQREAVAKADGFNNFNEMFNWFYKNHNLKNKNFIGNIICW